MKLLIFIFLFSVFSCLAYENPPKLPDEHITKCERFKDGRFETELWLAVRHPPSYRIECTVISSSSWIRVERTSHEINNPDGEPCSLYDVYTLTVVESVRNKSDLSGEVYISEIGIIEDNGDYGEFNLAMNTWARGTPADVYTTLVCQLDVSPEFIGYNATEILNDIPNNGINEYILFGDEVFLSTLDRDVFKFMPENNMFRLYFNFPDKGNGHSLQINVVQNDSSVFTKDINVGASISDATVDVNGLMANQIAYLELGCYGPVATVKDLKYKIIAFDYIEIDETLDWDDDGEKLSFKEDSNHNIRPLFVQIKNTEEVIFFQCESQKDVTINFYDDKFNDIQNNSYLHLFSDENSSIKFKRYSLSNLVCSGKTFIRMALNNEALDDIYLKLSRIKPVILVHGIDTSPRYVGDASFFGELVNNDQEKDLRPYDCQDFIWSSQKNIISKWVGNGKTSGTLGAFIDLWQNTHGIKATLIGHSAGCLMIYYHCQRNNKKFKNSVDNILFAAPPLLGSHMADMTGLDSWERLFSPFLKRTSTDNMDIISRGTKLNWERGTTKFNFDCSNLKIVIGYRQFIDGSEALNSAVDSLKKYNQRREYGLNMDILKNLVYNGNVSLDIWWDVLADSIEGIGELKYPKIATYNSELNKENPSDSAVGTYSANVTKNKNFEGASAAYTFKIHSDVQRFNSENDVFTEAVKSSLNKIGERE